LKLFFGEKLGIIERLSRREKLVNRERIVLRAGERIVLRAGERIVLRAGEKWTLVIDCCLTSNEQFLNSFLEQVTLIR